MRTSTCEQRDGYLGKWLSADEQAEFEHHLANCPDCRFAVQQEQRLDGLLTRANTALLPVPIGLVDQIDHRLRRARRQRMAAWAGGLAAAGILLCAVAAWFKGQPIAKDAPERRPVAALQSQPPQPMADPRSLVDVAFPPSCDVIAVPQETDNPSVTIIWVYPTIKATPADFSDFPERNGI